MSDALAPLTGNPPEFNIVMLYEDADAGRCAKQLSDRLLHKIGESYQCVRNLWSFDALGITDVGDAAADAARTADLLIVSVSGEREFSPHMDDFEPLLRSRRPPSIRCRILPVQSQ